MDFSELETFLMIVQTKSITKTADNLFLSQPTVSHRLKSLEEKLNMQLVIRKKGHKSVEFTSKGEEFIPIAERWMYLWKETQILQQGSDRILLSIGCIDTLSTTVFTPLYQRILNDYPLVDLRIKTHQSYEIYGLLDNHEIDLGFVYHHLYFKNIISVPILSETMYLVQSADTKLKKRVIHTDELNPENELFLSWETTFQIWHDQWINSKYRPRVQVDSFMLVCNLLSSGNMWMIAPASVVKSLADRLPVYISEIENQPPKRVCYLVKHKVLNAATEEAVRLFEDELNKYIASEVIESIEERYFDRQI